MSQPPALPTDPVKLHRELEAIWTSGRGITRFSAVNHTTLGKRFVVTAFIFFAIGGALAMLIRAQLATGHSAFVGPDLYSQIFTMHGTVMMFLFAIPMAEGFAIYLLPKMLGSRDMAFPRLTAYGYWCYLFGGSILIVALFFGVAPASGWFMYTPLSSKPYSPGINADVWLLGVTFVEISALSAAIEIIVSILKLRAPGMSLDRMPIFAWYMLVVAGMMLIGFPPLILGSILLELERAFDLPFFDPVRGGDPLLWQHLFWLFGHPEVYIIFLPAVGAVSMILPVFARNPLVGYRAIVVALIAMGFLSFGLWVHHMYATGIPHLALAFFSAASALVTIPTAIQFFAWLATLAHGRPQWGVPMLYIIGFFVIFVIGGLTGVMVAMVPFDLQAHDTHFVVAHLHYVLVGGFVFPMLAAAYYWLPHVTGKMPVYQLSIPAFWLIFGGFNLTFFIMHLTGLRGMPRRVHTYPDASGWEMFNLVSSIGGFILTIGFALVLIDVILQIRFGKPFRRNPWRAGTLEWATPTPPPSYAFASLPEVDRRSDLLEPEKVGPTLAAGRGYLGFARNGWMETLGVDMVSGRIEQVVVLPRQTYLPLWTALATGAFVLALLFKLYWAAPIAALIVLVLFLFWTPGSGLQKDHGPIDVGNGVSAPPHPEAPGAPSWWAMVLTLVADATLYASLLFGGLFLWLSAPAWPPPESVNTGWLLPLITAGALAVALVTGRWAAANPGARAQAWLTLCAAAHLTALAILLWLASGVPEPTGHAHAATSYVILLYCAFHAALGVVFAVFGSWRLRAGYASALRSLDLRIGALWHVYTAAAGIAGLAFLKLMAALAGGAGVAS